MAKSVRFKNGNEVYTIDATGVTAKSLSHKSLNLLVTNIDTLFVGNVYGTGVEEYYYLCGLGKNDQGDDAYVRLIGTAGGWVYNNLASFDITYSSRGNNGFGVWYGNATAWDWFDFRVFKGTDNYYRLYLHRKNKSYAGEIVMSLMSRSSLNTSNTPTSTPAGVLSFTIDNTKLTKIG